MGDTTDYCARDLATTSHCEMLCVYRENAGHGLHTFSAVTRSTPPSVLHKIVNEYRFQLSDTVILTVDGECGQ